MAQLRALLRLRWAMVRSRRVRLGLAALAGTFPVLLLAAAVGGQAVPPGNRALDVLLLAPTLFLVFAALALVAPLVAGGGNELFPEGQLSAYPVLPRTVFAGSLLMAPLNLAWVTQVVVLVGATGVVAERSPLVVLSVLTTLLYVGLVTVLGQAIGWAVVGVRQRRPGRLATQAAGGALALAGGVVVATGSTSALLDRSPTTAVVISAIRASQGQWVPWLVTVALLVGLTAVGARLGAAACAWTLRRTTPAGRPELAPVLRRPARRSPLAELVAVDRASVLRSTPLRRGALVLAVLPGLVAAQADPTWASLALLPGLVAAGAGLLFGVNAFCLDGSGAVFVATLPHPPRTSLLAKVVVVAQTCLVTVVLAVALTATQVRAVPTLAEAVALTGSVVGCTLLVVATCTRLSVERPHKADLRGPRDTPAPPATMAVYSLRLALVTTWPGLLFVAAGGSGTWQIGAASSLLVIALSLRSLLRTLRRWDISEERARVVSTVAYG